MLPGRDSFVPRTEVRLTRTHPADRTNEADEDTRGERERERVGEWARESKREGEEGEKGETPIFSRHSSTAKVGQWPTPANSH